MIEHAVEFGSAFGEYPGIVDLPVREFLLDLSVEFLVDLREVEFELGDVVVAKRLMEFLFLFTSRVDAQPMVELSLVLVLGGIGDDRAIVSIKG